MLISKKSDLSFNVEFGQKEIIKLQLYCQLTGRTEVQLLICMLEGSSELYRSVLNDLLPPHDS